MPATTGGVSFLWWLVIGAVAVAALWWLFAAPGRATLTGPGRDRDRARRNGGRGLTDAVSPSAQPSWTEQQGDGRAGVQDNDKK